MRYNYLNKPKLSSFQLVESMRDMKGIRFEIKDEASAVQFLREQNNYLRTAAYRKNFTKYQMGQNQGKYIDLDFAYLCELSILDLYLRQILFELCIDVEHALKVSLLTEIEDDPNEDGYHIVNAFLDQYPKVKNSIVYTSSDAFVNGLIDKYFSIDYSNRVPRITNIDCPVWVFVELLTFANFTRFYNDYYRRLNRKKQMLDMSIINPVRNLRNACGHNSCVLFNLKENAGKTKPGTTLTKFISQISGIGQRVRKKKLSCRPLFEISCLLYAEKKYVSEDVRQHGMEKLHHFVHGRLQKHLDYFSENQVITSAFDFLIKIVDGCL